MTAWQIRRPVLRKIQGNTYISIYFTIQCPTTFLILFLNLSLHVELHYRGSVFKKMKSYIAFSRTFLCFYELSRRNFQIMSVLCWLINIIKWTTFHATNIVLLWELHKGATPALFRQAGRIDFALHFYSVMIVHIGKYYTLGGSGKANWGCVWDKEECRNS